ncbi:MULTISPECIES: hypothetical protein [Commensalibacter]|nr:MULTISPECIES: hypothetical protein [Commensalibacter]MCT6842955.1 hypothetical protein [Commensalibacter sp.]MBH9969778.1 hypothetical protein [Commensalibacter sp. M0265]MBH9972446.1 hypothetical protein [Commensalibacter melissae]MBH9977326.1 hypothetical protein [Commensalibacter sp. M0266]MBH9992813.1 hypothetical protein [Commensalibacter sp. M0270]
MEKLLYVAGIIILFIGIVAAMWFLPFGRNLDADNQYLHETFYTKKK